MPAAVRTDPNVCVNRTVRDRLNMWGGRSLHYGGSGARMLAGARTNPNVFETELPCGALDACRVGIRAHLKNRRCSSSSVRAGGRGYSTVRRAAWPAQSPLVRPAGVRGRRSRSADHTGIRSFTIQLAAQCHGLPIPSVKCITLQPRARRASLSFIWIGSC